MNEDTPFLNKTDMDYEKEYNEMVRRCKELHESGNALTKLQMEIVCPELKAQDDESIRKELIDFVNQYAQREVREQFIPWLEKQKEQKPDCNGCAKHLEGYISGRTDAENKLLEKYGIVETPEDELKMKPRWKPSEEQMEALENTIYFDKTVLRKKRLQSLYEQLKKLI